MSFEYVAYDKLKASVKESIVTLIKHHNPKHKPNLDKLEDSVKEVSAVRQPQAYVLLKAIELLDKSGKSAEVKAHVLNALVYHIREKINTTEYGYVSPERSNFFNSLTTSLELTVDNKPERDDLFEMYKHLSKFLCANTYNNSSPRKGYLPEQPFEIEGYDIVADIRDLSKKIFELGDQIIVAAEELHKRQQKPAKSSGGIFGSLFGSSKPDPKSSKDNHSSTPSAVIK